MTLTDQMRAGLTLALFAAFSFAGPLWAQDPDSTRQAPSDSGNVTLLDFTVDPAANEPHVVFLQKGIVYRASFSQPGVTLRMRSYRNRQLPFLVDLTNATDASGGSELELYPQSDGDIELVVVVPSSVPVRFRLWSDARASERGRRSAEEGYWELGVDGLLGWHGDFDSQTGAPAGSGITLGGCLSVRNGPGPLGIINGCIVGAEWKLGGDTRGFFFFAEPLIRLSNGRRTDSGWRYEWGLAMRFAAFADGSGGTNFGPGILGLGAYLARDQRDLNGRGWRMYLIARADGQAIEVPDGFGNVDRKGRDWVPALQFGLGRYH